MNHDHHSHESSPLFWERHWHQSKLNIYAFILFLMRQKNTRMPYPHYKSLFEALVQAIRSYQGALRLAVLTHVHLRDTSAIKSISSRFGVITSSLTTQKEMTSESPTMQQNKGLENTTVAELLMTKGEEKVGSWIWCRTNDTVHDAVKQMAQNNIGSLVVLKPGDQMLIAGIFTERDYMRKMILQERQPKYTKVTEVMTDQNKLITVTSDTNILQAMQVMTENQIRHVPVVDGRIVGMISIVDVVRAVVEQQSGDVKRLNEFIKGDYY